MTLKLSVEFSDEDHIKEDKYRGRKIDVEYKFFPGSVNVHIDDYFEDEPLGGKEKEIAMNYLNEFIEEVGYDIFFKKVRSDNFDFYIRDGFISGVGENYIYLSTEKFNFEFEGNEEHDYVEIFKEGVGGLGTDLPEEWNEEKYALSLIKELIFCVKRGVPEHGINEILEKILDTLLSPYDG